MPQLKEITKYLDTLLNISNIPNDASNNGLQVEVGKNVERAVFGVDACRELFEVAIARKAQLVFVHHGISWGAEPRRFTGLTASRLEMLFNNGISLYAAHLPLDADPRIGHNALLADMVELEQRYSFAEYSGCEIACGGYLPEISSMPELVEKFESELKCNVRFFGDQDKAVKKIGIISGGGGMDGLLACIDEEIDCYITGEMDHAMYHVVKESGVCVIALGHYNSETPGVLAVMNELENNFSIECEFVDIPTGL